MLEANERIVRTYLSLHLHYTFITPSLHLHYTKHVFVNDGRGKRGRHGVIMEGLASRFGTELRRVRGSSHSDALVPLSPSVTTSARPSSDANMEMMHAHLIVHLPLRVRLRYHIALPYLASCFFVVSSDEFRICHVISYVLAASSYVHKISGFGPPSI